MKLFRGVKLKKNHQLILLAGVTGLLATGCQTYEQQNKIITDWKQGNLPQAVIEANKQADAKAQGKDAVIWQLEQGAVLRAAGQYTNSNEAFDKAQAKIDEYEQKAKVRIGQESGALLSNQANLPYEGRAYDGIMLNTYKALNYLALGDTDKARPEIIRAYQRQQDAVDLNKKRIQATQDAAAKSKDDAAIKKAQADQKLQSQLTGATTNLTGLAVYGDYVNPFTVYLDGLFFMVNAADGSDLERARKSFERVATYAPDNEFVKQDLAAVETVMDKNPLPPTTYVIFETGCAPERSQIRIDIPIIVVNVSYVGAAFPTLKLQDNYMPQLTVTFGDTNVVTTKTVASMDSVIGLDFKNDLPVVITKTIASTVIKAALAYAANQSAEQSGGSIAGLITRVATAGIQAALNIADERTWTTLPKEFQVARFPTPADHKVILSGGGGRAEVTVGDGTVNLIYVKAISANTPLLVTQIKLDGSPIVTTAPIHVTRSEVNIETNPPASPVVASQDNAATNTVPAAPVVPIVAVTNAPTETSPAITNATVNTVDANFTGNPEVATLVATLRADNPRLVIQALKELRRKHVPEAVPQILPCLNHYDSEVVRNACRTLAVLGDKSVIPAIEPLLQNQREDVRRDAQMAINTLQTKS